MYHQVCPNCKYPLHETSSGLHCNNCGKDIVYESAEVDDLEFEYIDPNEVKPN